MNSKPSAMEKAMRRLSSRDRTEKELVEYLKSQQYENEEIEMAVETLKDYGYVDDESYCKKYFVYARRKGRSAYRIGRELEQKGIPFWMVRQVQEQMVEDAMELESEDRKMALEVAEKMYQAQKKDGKEIDQRFLGRVGRRLAGLGYESGIVYDILGKLQQRK